jgi:aminoglycoside 6-adenylyltransferase
VRALVLESSRASGSGAKLDPFSDYDVLVVVSDLAPFASDEAWLRVYGAPLVMLRGEDHDARDGDTLVRLVLYEDDVKVDYIVTPTTFLRGLVERRESHELLDWGYRTLVDKDGLTAKLPAPTRTAHIPARPSLAEYAALVEEFWWEATYVAKNLWRDDLMQAKYNLDVVMRHQVLLQLLEWRIELDHNWSWKPGPVGKGLKSALQSDLWVELEKTWVGASIEENWIALFAMTALFRHVAVEVGNALGYTYPLALDEGVSAYLRRAHDLPAGR